ncbi:MAG: helix-turn-helix domain-containing protein [Verrucomicrobiales bacterium]
MEITGQGQATVSKTLKMMREAGLFERKLKGFRAYYRSSSLTSVNWSAVS